MTVSTGIDPLKVFLEGLPPTGHRRVNYDSCQSEGRRPHPSGTSTEKQHMKDLGRGLDQERYNTRGLWLQSLCRIRS